MLYTGMTVYSRDIFHWEDFFLQSWLLFQIGFVVMKIQRILENNTEPITCSKSDGADLESIIIPSENLRGQGKISVTN